jgi:hypothetical protein
MEGNCLISFFSCCSQRKRTVAPADTVIYNNLLQNASTQTPIFAASPFAKANSLPLLKSSLQFSHKPTIMIRNSNSSNDRSIEEYSRQKERNFTVRIEKGEVNEEYIRRKIERNESVPLKFWDNNGKNLPRLIPVTPKRTSKRIKLPYINRKYEKEEEKKNDEIES